jgi:hypothetical protein
MPRCGKAVNDIIVPVDSFGTKSSQNGNSQRQNQVLFDNKFKYLYYNLLNFLLNGSLHRKMMD